MSTAEEHATDTGSLIGPWRILERMGRGNCGVVYRVCLAEDPGAGEYALKLARWAGDLRFEREGELLSRIHHPRVPGLKGQGVWQVSQRGWRPYLVMQWVQGLPLYLWAKQSGITSRQALRVLGQVARALEATHEHGVHRDVKGDNVLVTSEGDAALVDFGCCWYEGARPLTEEVLPPGTWPYRSPQALRREAEGAAAQRYVGTAADDVYALGVTAYRLVTGTYPRRGSEDAPRLLAPSELATVAPELEALILRMLSEYPSVRGSAGELAEALEQAEKSAGSVADERVRPSRSILPTERALRPGPTRWHLASQALRRHSKLLGMAGSLAAGVLAGVLLAPRSWHIHEEEPELLAAIEEEQEHAGVEERAVGLADGGVEGVLAAAEARSTDGVPSTVLGLPMPKQPRPGWRRPPCGEAQRPINGACWWTTEGRKPPCEEAYEHDGKCYAPVISRNTPRPPTSDEP